MLWGTLINALAILFGSSVGLVVKRIPENWNRTLMQGVGLVTVVIGLSMALKSDRMLLVLLSVAFGGLLGSALELEECFTRWSESLERRFEGGNSFSTGFVTGTLIFCVGPMAILGSLDSGLRGDHHLLFTKAMLDGFTSAVLASTLGAGVLFTAIPVFVYQGLIALAANWITHWIHPAELNVLIRQVSAVGGVLILAIGANLLRITKIPVADLLPALLLAALGSFIFPY